MADIILLSKTKQDKPPKAEKASKNAVIIWFKMSVAVYYDNKQCGILPAMPMFETREKA